MTCRMCGGQNMQESTHLCTICDYRKHPSHRNCPLVPVRVRVTLPRGMRQNYGCRQTSKGPIVRGFKIRGNIFGTDLLLRERDMMSISKLANCAPSLSGPTPHPFIGSRSAMYDEYVIPIGNLYHTRKGSKITISLLTLHNKESGLLHWRHSLSYAVSQTNCATSNNVDNNVAGHPACCKFQLSETLQGRRL